MGLLEEDNMERPLARQCQPEIWDYFASSEIRTKLSSFHLDSVYVWIMLRVREVYRLVATGRSTPSIYIVFYLSILPLYNC
jgi:hypothetical protein